MSAISWYWKHLILFQMLLVKFEHQNHLDRLRKTHSFQDFSFSLPLILYKQVLHMSVRSEYAVSVWQVVSQIVVISTSLNHWRHNLCRYCISCVAFHACQHKCPASSLNERQMTETAILTYLDEHKTDTWSTQLTGNYILQGNQKWDLSRH